jgi:hypothetical protein
MLDIIETFFALFALGMSVPLLGWLIFGLGGSALAKKEARKQAEIIKMPTNVLAKSITTKRIAG